MIYQGTERRRHRVYVTRNTEYHTRDGICVAVRDRKSNAFRTAHIALALKVEGGVKIYPNGACVPNVQSPGEGDAIFFTHVTSDGEERQIVTSRLEKVDRPPKRDVLRYPPLPRSR
ncbi:MAG TPA: hypothetical protein VHB21_27135 [Minicystis sp.]|nr:hypothetical protein [Minicystis sp.]